MELLITSVVEKKNNLNEQNFEVYWKIRTKNRGSGIKERLKNLKIKYIHKSWIVVMWATKLQINFTKHNPAGCTEH